MKKRRRRNKVSSIALLGFITVVVLVIVYLYFKPKLKDHITMEAGSPLVDVKEFLLDEDSEGVYVTDLDSLNPYQPGVYGIKIKIGSRTYKSYLEIIDTTAPTADVVNRIAFANEPLEAEAFVVNISDVTEVQVTYKDTPDFIVPGKKEVGIVLTDTSDNRTELTAFLNVLEGNKVIQVEAGSVNSIKVEDFIKAGASDAFFLTDVTKLNLNKLAKHEVQFNLDGSTATVYVEVVDTTPPSAAFHSQEVWMDESLEPDSFVSDIVDATPVRIYYKETPDFSTPGEHEAIIILEDQSHNTREQKVSYTVKEDTEAPRIIGTIDRTVYIGEAVSFRKGVSVLDNKDQDLSFEVDSSSVNLKQEGTYEVTYSATDLNGNTTSRIINVLVKKQVISEDEINQLADGILAEIINATMTQREKAYAIYVWVRAHVGYTGTSDKTDWLKEAYRGITEGVGDCFTYYAVSQALLTRAGIENIRITRVGGETQHFWSLVNCGDGWYHFDTTRHKDGMQSFMLTDAETKEYTKIRGNNYYVYDESLYPDIE